MTCRGWAESDLEHAAHMDASRDVSPCPSLERPGRSAISAPADLWEDRDGTVLCEGDTVSVESSCYVTVTEGVVRSTKFTNPSAAPHLFHIEGNVLVRVKPYGEHGGECIVSLRPSEVKLTVPFQVTALDDVDEPFPGYAAYAAAWALG